jgi:hypothetical protein
MKTIKLQLIVLLCFTNITLFAQDAERFIGTFRIVGECGDLIHEFNFSEERDIVLSAGNESDLLLEMQAFSSKSYLQVFIHNDSIFIPLQPFEDFDGTQAFFSGEGKIINDSIFLHYKAGGTFGEFECNGKGKKMTTNIETVKQTPFSIRQDLDNIIIEFENNFSGTLYLHDLSGKLYSMQNIKNGKRFIFPLNSNFDKNLVFLITDNTGKQVTKGKLFPVGKLR